MIDITSLLALYASIATILYIYLYITVLDNKNEKLDNIMTNDELLFNISNLNSKISTKDKKIIELKKIQKNIENSYIDEIAIHIDRYDKKQKSYNNLYNGLKNQEYGLLGRLYKAQMNTANTKLIDFLYKEVDLTNTRCKSRYKNHTEEAYNILKHIK